jgi:predicted butyrate kinase (DUF1464 family)
MLVVTVGIDPGTRSFDVVVLSDGEVIEARSYSSATIAKEGYESILELIKKHKPDIVVGPSGYGTPIVCNEDIVNPRLFVEKILLLSGYAGESLHGDVHGGEVYVGMIKLVDALWKSEINTCYMPGVIHLTTVPYYRKINKIDMGTVDKLASAFYVLYRLGEETNYNEINIVLAELGYGYNAVLLIEKGRITDGHGGTVVSNSLLSIGGLDAEIPAILGWWSRELNFSGGVLSACEATEPEEALSRREEKCRNAFQAMIYTLAKNIYALKRESVKQVYLTGRLSRIREVREYLEAEGLKVQTLPLGLGVKEAAVGYSLLGDGLVGGKAKLLFNHMRISEACGGTLDWVIHPAFDGPKRKFHEAVRESLSREAWERFSCGDA